MEISKIILGLGGRARNDGKRERHSSRAAVFSSPQAYGQETFTVIAARKRPLRKREDYGSCCGSMPIKTSPSKVNKRSLFLTNLTDMI